MVRASTSVAVPKTLDDLTKPAYKGLLVVENPATSSPGLAFLLATIARYGDDGWRDYWAKLRANDVKVVDGWEQAYDGDFTAGRQARARTRSWCRTRRARRPRSTSPNPQPKTSPIGTMLDSCFRQVEFAGVLKGTEHRGRGAQARRLHARRSSSRTTSRSRCSCSRCATARRCPPVFDEVRRGRRRPAARSRRPTIGAAPRRVDRAVDRHRAAVSAARGAVGGAWLAVVPLAFLGVFFVYPVVTILGARARRPTARSTSTRSATCSPTPSLRHVVWFTVWQAALSTVLTLAVALPGAYVLAPLRVPRPARSCARW